MFLPSFAVNMSEMTITTIPEVPCSCLQQRLADFKLLYTVQNPIKPHEMPVHPKGLSTGRCMSNFTLIVFLCLFEAKCTDEELNQDKQRLAAEAGRNHK